VRSWIGSLAPTGQLSESAMDALRSSAAALLIFDRAAAQSEHVERHLLVARQSGKPLIPLRVGRADETMLPFDLPESEWIDWSDPAAPAEIRQRAYHYAPVSAAPAYGDAGAVPGRKPRIEVLQTGSAAAAAPYAQPHRAPAAAAAAPARARSRGLSPTILLALLAAAAVIGALLYNSSLFSGDDREKVAQRTETVTYKPVPETGPAPVDETAPASEGPWGPASEGTEPDIPEPAPARPPAAATPSAPAPRQAPATPAPREVAAADAARPPAATPPAPAAEPEPADAPSEAGAPGAAAAVRSFYSALSAGNGAAAAQQVIPGKRQSGPLSAGSLSRYYSSFRRPLRIRSVTPVDGDTVRVAYDYVLSDGRLCEGVASVNVVQSGGRSLISGIRTRGPC
jgi:hypothetical protein